METETTSSKLMQRYHALPAKISDVSTKSQSIAMNSESTAKKTPPQKKTKRKKWKKPKDKPKRPLSAYNLFFRDEREKLISSKFYDAQKAKIIGFAGLAKHIASKWKNLDEDARKIYENPAHLEQIRYKAELDAWKKGRKEAVSNMTCDKKLDELSPAKDSNKGCGEQPDQGIRLEDKKISLSSDIIKKHQAKVSPVLSSIELLKIPQKLDTATQSLQQRAASSTSESRKNATFTNELTALLLSATKIEEDRKNKLVLQGIQQLINNDQACSLLRSNQQNPSLLNLEQARLLQKLSYDLDTTAAIQLVQHRYEQQRQQQQSKQASNNNILALQKLLLLETARQERDNVQREVALLTRQIQNIQQMSTPSIFF